MPENPSTAANAGSTNGGQTKAHHSKLILGETEELADNVFKLHTKDQADSYIRTMKAIAQFAGRKYGKNMRNLIKNGKVLTFTEPTPPAGATPTPGELAKYNQEYK